MKNFFRSLAVLAALAGPAQAATLNVTPGSGAVLGQGLDGSSQLLGATIICGAAANATLYATCVDQVIVNGAGQMLTLAAESGTWVVTGAGGTFPVTGTFWQATQPVSIAAMPTTPVTGTFWQATQPVSGTFWQTTQPVSIATMPSTPVTGTFWQTTQPVSIATMPSTPVTGTFWQTTQPISAAALPLPTGAMPSSGGTVGLVAGAAIAGKFGIDQTTPGTTNGVQVSGALPAGANLLGKVGIDQTTVGTTNGVSLAQVGATTILAGSGAVGAGSPRMAVAVDAATIAGSAPSTVLTTNNAQWGGTAITNVPTAVGTQGTGNTATINAAVTSSVLPTGASNAANQTTIANNTSALLSGSTPTAYPGSGAATTITELEAIRQIAASPSSVGGFNAVVTSAPTVTNSAYVLNNAIGGLQTVAAFRTSAQPSGLLSYVQAISKGGGTTSMTIYGFIKSPASTCTDHAAFALSSTDLPFMIPGFPVSVVPATANGTAQAVGSIALSPPVSVANADTSATVNLYFCAVTNGTPTPATTSDLTFAYSMVRD